MAENIEETIENTLSELEKDAANLLFALHDAWPYVHQWCTIESTKKSIQALIVKHGDFADLHEPQKKSPGQTDQLPKNIRVHGWVWKDKQTEDDCYIPSYTPAQHVAKGELLALVDPADLHEPLQNTKWF